MVVPPSSVYRRPQDDSDACNNETARSFRDEQFYRTVLELEPGTSAEAIKRAYKEQLMKYHPDRVQHLGKEFQQMAEHKTKLITEAFAYFREKFDL